MLELKRLSIVITKVQCKYTILHENKKYLIKSDYLCYAPIYYKKKFIKNMPWYYHYVYVQLYEDERKKCIGVIAIYM